MAPVTVEELEVVEEQEVVVQILEAEVEVE